MRTEQASCKACGQVLGELHRCERCRALAAVIERDGKLNCAACGIERESRPGLIHTTVGEQERTLRASKVVPWSLFAGATLSGAAGLSVAAVLGAAAVSAAGRVLAVLLGLASLACASALTWVGRTQLERTKRRQRFELEQRVVGLAYQRQGRLDPASVAQALAMSSGAADAFLTELTKVGRARMEVAEGGQITYVFADARPTRGIRVRGRDSTGAHSTRRPGEQ